MTSTRIFTSKAEIYARSRWGYAPEAIQAIFADARLDASSTVVDMGSGTGILTRHFAGKVGHVFAVEPNAAMGQQALRYLAGASGWNWVQANAEDTGLPDVSIDLITAAHALDWFPAAEARAEFRRLLKPGGRLAVLYNRITDERLLELLPRLRAYSRPDVRPANLGNQPPAYYFEGGSCKTIVFPFTLSQTWENFLGGIISTSDQPDEGMPGYAEMVKTARSIFEQAAHQDQLFTRGETQLIIGQMTV